MEILIKLLTLLLTFVLMLEAVFVAMIFAALLLRVIFGKFIDKKIKEIETTEGGNKEWD